MVARAQTPNEPPAPAASVAVPAGGELIYPDHDGLPMAENTLQFSWIVLLKENLDAQRSDFVAGDLLWYPVEGRPTERLAPDVLVAVGRPKGYRGSYQQWVEGIPPTVVIEVLSPGNTLREMMRKAAFYERHGVREFIVIDPESATGWAYIYEGGMLAEEVASLDGWTSPALGMTFAREGEELRVIGPDGKPFETLTDAKERASLAAERASRLAEKLRALGIDPDAP